MGTVTIQFEGVCVHFQRQFHPDLPCAHRVVLPNASQITSVWNNAIKPHVAGFSLSGVFNDAVPLTGAMLQIENSPGFVSYDGFDIVPQLSGPKGLDPNLGGPSSAVLYGHNPAFVACFFDFNQAVATAFLGQGGAVYTSFTVTTTDDQPQLQITPFPTGLSSTPPQVMPAINITSPTIFVWNEELVPPGSTNDFLLSYLTAEDIPVNQPPGIPPTGSATKSQYTSRKVKLAALDDPGCSNSQYP